MYYIEKIPLIPAHFLAGSVAEPSAREVAWAPGAWAVGAEVVRPDLHRVFKCAVARTAADVQPPEQDRTSWAEMRFSDRWLPFGPMARVDGKIVYESGALEMATGDIEYRLQLRYCNAVALFGLRGAAWAVDVYDAPGGNLVHSRTGTVKSPARGYWDYAYGQRSYRDRVMITDLPIFPTAEVRIRVTAAAGQLRRVAQIEVGKLRFLPGVEIDGEPSGTAFGLRRSPRAYSYSEEQKDGSTVTILYGATYDMSGRIRITGSQEDGVLERLRALLGRGVAYKPVQYRGYEQSLVFGVLESADVVRESAKHAEVDFQIRGLPAN